MRVGIHQLPRAVLVLALALARGDRFEMLKVAELIRGLAIQVSLRWVTGGLLYDGHSATLLYSELDPVPRRRLRRGIRTVLGTTLGAVVGIVLVLAANLLFMLPIGALLRLLGMPSLGVQLVALVVVFIRLTWTGARAVRTYALERRRQAAMPRIGNAARWRLDLLGATPAGRGHGARLMKHFVARADAANATVYLICEPENRAFYRRAGFHVVTAPATPDFSNMLLMRRVAPAVGPRHVPMQRASRPAVLTG